ncbi:hypothetical protein [Breoghania sp.]|uniref:hypothetical protein n=1 Tax=Breoghania sp. TaxID=2065378 RepID=UPI002635BFA0|nr:hypothetical protein [Breoghania sp.]MDJ0933199.1 hypothetical protein [Breoghania sp.]
MIITPIDRMEGRFRKPVLAYTPQHRFVETKHSPIFKMTAVVGGICPKQIVTDM